MIEPMASEIPARIIQTAKSRDLPVLAQAAAASMKSLNPGFEYLFFDNQEVDAFVKKEFPEYFALFEAFPYRIQKYDFFRYLIVFRLGGFYFDLDVFLARSLEELRPRGCVFPFEELTINRCLRRTYNMDWEIGNYAFGATAQHPFLKAIIDNCVRAQQEPGWVRPMMQGIPPFFQSEFQVLLTTGPGLVSRTFAENPSLAEAVAILFPEDVCNEQTWHHFGNYGVHVMEGSWRTGSSYLRRRMGNLWEAWTLRKGLEESRHRGKTRTIPRQNHDGVTASLPAAPLPTHDTKPS